MVCVTFSLKGERTTKKARRIEEKARSEKIIIRRRSKVEWYFEEIWYVDWFRAIT